MLFLGVAVVIHTPSSAVISRNLLTRLWWREALPRAVFRGSWDPFFPNPNITTIDTGRKFLGPQLFSDKSKHHQS
jgi:hypothetical protein